MAIEFKGVEVTRGSEYLLYPEAITIKADLNGRHDAPDITALKDDILRRGQLQPVVFRKEGDVPGRTAELVWKRRNALPGGYAYYSKAMRVVVAVRGEE